jgi:hypothetical protein
LIVNKLLSLYPLVYPIAARRWHTQKLQGEGEGEGEGEDEERMWAFSDDEDDYA